jgi:hypothetical protein
MVRTAFLATLETPEPRYVLVCFPILLGLAAQVFVRKGGEEEESSGLRAAKTEPAG